MGVLNKVLLVGLVCREVEFRKTSGGKSVCGFGLAVKSLNDSCYFANITAWEKTADFCRDHLRKGSLVLVEGCLYREKWTSKAGEPRERTVVNAFGLQILDRIRSRKQEDQEAQETIPEDYAPPMRSYETAPSNHSENFPQYAGRNTEWQDEDIPF